VEILVEGGIPNMKHDRDSTVASIELSPDGIKRVLVYADTIAEQEAAHQLLASVTEQLFLLDLTLRAQSGQQ
jgi:hypothetical protein